MDRLARVDEVVITEDMAPSYPYRPKGYPVDPTLLLGMCLVETFKPQYLSALGSLIKSCLARRVLVFTSGFMLPHVMEAIAVAPHDWEGGSEVRFVKCHNRYWGGNMHMCDLMTVDDFIAQLSSLYSWMPDLVVMSESSFHNG